VLELLVPQYDVTVLFYNPNIEPHTEYEKRKAEITKLLNTESFINRVAFIECEYDNTAFTDAVSFLRNEPEGGNKCLKCYELRLGETARRAKTGCFDIFATTLSVSPHKNAALLNEIGNKLAGEYDIEYLTSDFKKREGYKRSVELSKHYKLYRQDYCGCIESVNYK